MLISQLLLSAVVGTNPYFQDVALDVRGDRIYCSASLEESFTPDLDRLLQSGDNVIIHFEVDVVDQATDSVVALSDWEHHLRYSLLEDNYTLFNSETGRNLTIDDFDIAKSRWVRVEDALICRMRDLREGGRYYLRMSAFMEDVSLPGITEKINMMAFWNRIRPTYESDPFEKRELVL